jgi:hypothetical protein
MPIRPIDLQTLLMQMSQVGRDQAVEKDGQSALAAQQAALAQKRDVEAKEAVTKPEEPSDGARAIKDRGGSASKEHGERKGEEEDAEGGAAGEEEVVRDPQLGNKVDLSG